MASGLASSWTCSACTLDNEPSVRVCGACETVRQLPAAPGPQFSCPFCAGKLPANSTKCPSCLYVLKPDVTKNVHISPLSEWNCQLCSYLNHPSLAECEICGSRRRGARLVRVPSEGDSSTLTKTLSTVSKIIRSASLTLKSEPQKWKCSKCALENPANAESCEVCCNPRIPPRTKTFASPTTSPVVWLCKLCSTMNVLPSQTCQKCAESKISVLKWTCAYCQFPDNPCTSIICQSCRESKMRKTTWPCPRCTFENKKESSSCEMCRYTGTSADSMLTKDEMDLIDDEAEKCRNAIIEACIAAGEKFVDADFLPDDKALYRGGVPPNPDAPKVTWKRPMYIRSPRPEENNLEWRVMDRPRPADIRQGGLGDCWLLSALTVMTEKPELLEKVMISQELNEHGVYQIRLCKDGEWQVVTIDDYLPCTEDGFLVYSWAKRRQLWVPLIEKAMAKLHGSYEALMAGKSIEGLAALTGSSCESIELQQGGANSTPVDADDIWARILSSRDAKFLMGASCGAGNMNVDDDVYQGVGLRPRHAYSILDVKYGNMDDGQVKKLVCLRNPWGSFAWQGEWAENHHCWQRIRHEDRAAMTQHRAEDGCFWMSLDDVIQYFDSIDVCYLRSNWYDLRVPLSLPSRADVLKEVVEFQLEEPTLVDISLFQPDERGDQCSNLMDLCLMIFTGTGKKTGQLVESSHRRTKKFIMCSKFLGSGNYVIVTTAFNHWKREGPADGVKCTLVLHSSKIIVADVVKVPSSITTESLCSLAMMKGKVHEGGQGLRAFYLSEGWCGMILVVQNFSWTEPMCIETDFTDSWNVVSTRGTYKTTDILPPRHKQVLSVMTQMEPSDQYRVVHKLRHWPLPVFGGLQTEHTPPLEEWNCSLHLPIPLPDDS